MNRATATHEAGHAIGRLLTASMMGYEPSEAVEYIEIGGSIVIMPNGDQRRSMGQTVGPMVSRPLEMALEPYADGRMGVDVWKAIKIAGHPDDRHISMATKMLICVMGAAAEAKLQRMPDPTSTFLSPECNGDRSDFGKCCSALDLTYDEAKDTEHTFLVHAKGLVKREFIWKAINAIAFELVKAQADMPGRAVFDLAWPILQQDSEVEPLPLGWASRSKEQLS